MAGSKEQIGRNCPYCGAIITYDEFFCRACHKRLYDQQDFSAPSTVKPETFVVPMRNPFIAGGLSLLSPGLGQFCAACFDGKYITGDVTPEMLQRIEDERKAVGASQLPLPIQ